MPTDTKKKIQPNKRVKKWEMKNHLVDWKYFSLAS